MTPQTWEITAIHSVVHAALINIPEKRYCPTDVPAKHLEPPYNKFVGAHLLDRSILEWIRSPNALPLQNLLLP